MKTAAWVILLLGIYIISDFYNGSWVLYTVIGLSLFMMLEEIMYKLYKIIKKGGDRHD